MDLSRARGFLLQPPSEVASELQAAMDRQLAAQLGTILPALAAIVLSIAGVRLFLGPAGAGNSLNWLTFATGLASLASWILLRRNRVAADRTQLIALAMGSLIVIHSLAEFYRR